VIVGPDGPVSGLGAHMIRSLACTLLAIAAAGATPVAAQEAQPAPPLAASPQPQPVLVQRDTPVRLMVLNEVSTRSARAGDKFVLRVDEDVVVGGVTVIPVGAKAWGEVVSAEASGALGRSGKLEARLLYIDAGGERIPIGGENRSAGQGGGRQVTMGMVGFGLAAPLAAPLTLFAPGNNARLKAGDIYSAFIERDMLFDPAAKTFAPAPAPAPPPQ
jgi:hypothetical protein